MPLVCRTATGFLDKSFQSSRIESSIVLMSRSPFCLLGGAFFFVLALGVGCFVMASSRSGSHFAHFAPKVADACKRITRKLMSYLIAIKQPDQACLRRGSKWKGFDFCLRKATMAPCWPLYQRHTEPSERGWLLCALSFARWWPDQALIRINMFIVFRPQSCLAKPTARRKQSETFCDETVSCDSNARSST
jgi:hypothetical protein